MTGRVRAIAVRLLLPLLRGVGRCCFDGRCLSGRHFERRGSGWHWLLRSLVWQTGFGFNRHVPWPVSPFMLIANPANVRFHPDDLNNFQMPGTFFANPEGMVVIGRGTRIGPNVGLITVNHDPEDVSKNLPGEDIVLGEGCWIGMNAVVLPGVTLGPGTVVGAGAVVSRSFPEGGCVVAGVPARLVRRLPSTFLNSSVDVHENAGG